MPSICRDRTARFGGSRMAMHRQVNRGEEGYWLAELQKHK